MSITTATPEEAQQVCLNTGGCLSIDYRNQVFTVNNITRLEAASDWVYKNNGDVYDIYYATRGKFVRENRLGQLLRQTNELSQHWACERHQMETSSALLAFDAGDSLVTCEFPLQRPVTRRFDVFFDLCLNQQLSKQWRRRWFETPSRSLWRHCNA